MGELDEDHQDVVDEQLWNPKEDGDLQPGADEKVERDAPVDPSGEEQMEAKDESEPQKKKQKVDQAEGQQEEAQPKKDDIDEGNGEENTSPENEDVSGNDEAIRPETEYEDSHHRDLQQPEDEMPEDLPSGIDEAEGGASDGSDKLSDTQEHLDEMPTDDIDTSDPPPQGEEDTGQVPAEEGAQVDEEDIEQANPEDVPGGLQGLNEEETLQDDEEIMQDEASEDVVERAKRKQYDEQQAFEDVKGSNTAADQVSDVMAQAESRGEHDEHSESAHAAQKLDSTGGDDVHQQSKPAPADNKDQQSARRKQSQPNPYHELGNALEHWHQQLQLVQREPMEQGDETNASETRSEANGQTEVDGCEFEIVGKESKADTQVILASNPYLVGSLVAIGCPRITHHAHVPDAGACRCNSRTAGSARDPTSEL